MSKADLKKIKVLKASGEYEPYSEEKVRVSLRRVGAGREFTDEIIKLLEPELYDGITTHKIYKHVFKYLKGRGTHLASKYNLKRAIMDLGPSGYPFEKFFAKILEHEGFKVKTNKQIKGKCAYHEVDVVAERDKKKYMVEAKFHNKVGTKTTTRVALYIYGRFLDVSASDKFDEGWLVTNTKVTSGALKYCNCVGLKVISWDHPENFSLRNLIDKSGLHPVTALVSISGSDKKALLEQGVVTCRELLENVNLLPKNKRAIVKSEAEKICS